MLILFDIDATLLTTGGAGVRAMGDAGREIIGAHFREDGIDFAGGLDPALLEQLLIRNGAEVSEAALARMRAGYGEHLRRRIEREPGVCKPLPGVIELLGALTSARANGLALGLLTGNFPETGEMKIRAAGIGMEQFTVHAWGCDSPHTPALREHLTPVAMARHRERHGREVAPGRVVVIGDTPHDVRCARVHGCRSLAVGTGKYSVEALRDAGATRVVPNLADTPEILGWLAEAPDA